VLVGPVPGEDPPADAVTELRGGRGAVRLNSKGSSPWFPLELRPGVPVGWSDARINLEAHT
jgi:hypothetical protein